MKEHPILFSAPMVRAIQAGRKKMTRRVVKPQLPDNPTSEHHKKWGLIRGDFYYCGVKCPYGQPGDRLWVRETWNITHKLHLAPGEKIGKTLEDCVRDNGGFGCPCADGVVYKADGVSYHPEYGKAVWKPSIHMPRWASRITLDVVGVRVERLQGITEEDAKAEGVEPLFSASEMNLPGLIGKKQEAFGYKNYLWHGNVGHGITQKQSDAHGHQFSNYDKAAGSFGSLWDSINAKSCPWDSNPWVWVIEFKKT